MGLKRRLQSISSASDLALSAQLPLDRVAFDAALVSLGPRLCRSPYCFTRDGAGYDSLSFLSSAKYAELPATLGELFERDLTDIARANMVTLLTSRELFGAPRRYRCDASLELDHHGFVFIRGDLDVAGDLAYRGTVLIAGNLRVGGVVEDTVAGSSLLVAGDAAAGALYIGSEVWIGGTLDVRELVFLRFTRGGKTLHVENGLRCPLLVTTPYDSSFIGTQTSGKSAERDDVPEVLERIKKLRARSG